MLKEGQLRRVTSVVYAPRCMGDNVPVGGVESIPVGCVVTLLKKALPAEADTPWEVLHPNGRLRVGECQLAAKTVLVM